MLLTFFRVAYALDVECDGSGASLSQLVEAYSGSSESVNIRVTADACLDGEAILVSSTPSLTLSCELPAGSDGAAQRCAVPYAYLYDSGVSFNHFEFTSFTFTTLISPFDSLLGTVTARVISQSGSLVCNDCGFEGDGNGDGVLGLDSNVELIGAQMSNLGSGSGVIFYPYREDVTLTIADSHFEGLGNVAVHAQALSSRGSVASLNLSNSTFKSNNGELGGDVYAVGDAVYIDGCTFSGSSSNLGGPVLLEAEVAVVSRSRFEATEGVYSNSILATGGTLSLEQNEFINVSDGVGFLWKLYGLDYVALYHNHVELSSPAYIGANTAELYHNDFVLADADGVIRSDNTYLSFYQNEFCGGGGRRFTSEALISSYGSSLSLAGNIFHGLNLGSTPLVSTYDELGSGDVPSAVVMTDNTLVDVDAGTLLEGPISSLDFVNNLISGPGVGLTLSDDTALNTTGYNLWHSTDGATSSLPYGWGPDISATDAGFQSSYTRGVCDSIPGITDASPAAGTGYFGDDVGAVDRGFEDDWRDVGDTAEPDTGTPQPGVDSDGDGVEDALDCEPLDPQVFPGAADRPDDSIDQDCDGSVAAVRYTGGCFGSASFALVLPLLLFTRSRRRP